MTCKKCTRKSQVSLSYEKEGYCEECFLKTVEKRIRKEHRIQKTFKPKEKIYLLNDGSKEFRVSKYYLEKIWPLLKITEVKKKIKHAQYKLVIPSNLDREINKRFMSLLTNKKLDSQPKNQILFLNNLLEEEIIHICQLMRFKIGKKEKKIPFIEQLETEHPGTKFSMIKSFNLIP